VCNTLHSGYCFFIHTVENIDYTITPPDIFEATFISGSTVGATACDSITILDDNDLEGPHSFDVQISGSTPSGSQIMATAMATVEIQDNDGTCYIIV